MKTKNEFKEFYNLNLVNGFNTEDINRYKKFKTYLHLRWYFILPIVLLCIFGSFYNNINSSHSLLPIIGIVICMALILVKPKIHFPDVSKTTTIKKISKFVNETIDYSDSTFVPYKLLYKSDLYNGEYPYIHSDSDHFSGNINNIGFEFSNISLIYKSDNKEATDHNTYSKDFIFFHADLNKKFWGKIFIFPDYLESSLGDLSQSFKINNTSFGEIVKLENIEFERIFKVYSDSQVKARYILTSSVMEKLVELSEQLGNNLKISFIDSHMYILLPGHLDLGSILEFNYINNLICFEEIFRHYQTISIFSEIVEKLNLDSNIYSDQSQKASI